MSVGKTSSAISSNRTSTTPSVHVRAHVHIMRTYPRFTARGNLHKQCQASRTVMKRNAKTNAKKQTFACETS
jgi:hypothetical protein